MMEGFEAIFQAIRALYARHAPDCVVLYDSPGNYILATHEVRAKDGYRTWLGGVQIKKGYVSAHMMPVYAHPELLDGISETLRKRMQGKSCFNFKVEDPALFAELGALLDAGVARFRADGRLTPPS
jgi:hypothetical protein